MLVREADAETLDGGASMMRLIADSDDTDDVINANRTHPRPRRRRR